MPVQGELQFTRMRVLMCSNCRPKRKIASTDFDRISDPATLLFLVVVSCFLFVVVWRFILLIFTGSQ